MNSIVVVLVVVVVISHGAVVYSLSGKLALPPFFLVEDPKSQICSVGLRLILLHHVKNKKSIMLLRPLSMQLASKIVEKDQCVRGTVVTQLQSHLCSYHVLDVPFI